MPSFIISLFMLAVGAIVAWGLYVVDTYALKHQLLSVEQVIWAAINKLGWWYWSIHIALSLIGLLYTATLDRPRTHWGMVTRIVTLAGFNLYIFSAGNTGFGPIASVMVLCGLVMFIRQRSIETRARRDAGRADFSKAPWMVRAYASLTTDVDAILKRPDDKWTRA